MTSLGSYILICSVFVFFTIAEFALVLLLKEVKDQGLNETKSKKDESKSAKFISTHLTEVQNTLTRTTPLEAMNYDLTEEDDTLQRRTTSRIKTPNCFKKLTLSRKIDLSTFVVYYLAFLLFNIIYWL